MSNRNRNRQTPQEPRQGARTPTPSAGPADDEAPDSEAEDAPGGPAAPPDFLFVRARAGNGFTRCGRRFGKDPVPVRVSELGPGELERLQNEVMLVCEEASELDVEVYEADERERAGGALDERSLRVANARLRAQVLDLQQKNGALLQQLALAAAREERDKSTPPPPTGGF